MTCFFPTSFIPISPHSLSTCPGKEEALYSRSQALDFQFLLGALFYKFEKGQKQPT